MLKTGDSEKRNAVTVPQMKEYVNDLQKHRENVSEKPSKSKCGVPLTVETPILHHISHDVNDTFRDHLCHDLSGDGTKLYAPKELKENLLAIEEIRCAEKELIEADERKLRTGNGIVLRPCALNDGARKENVYGIHEELRQLRLCLDKERPKLNIEYCKPKIMRNYPMIENSESTNLFISPSHVRFNSFVPGKIYKKKVMVTNAGKRLTPFKLQSSDSSHSAFHYDYAPKCPLAAGMSAKLTVTFKCTSMEYVYELITVITRDDKKINILISAENEMPLLKYIVDNCDIDTMFEKPTRRSVANICVFECNACLVGASKTTTVRVNNVNRSAMYVCVPENVWYTKPVKEIIWKNSMDLGVFKITPSIFKINRGQTIQLNVTFEPRLPSFYCSRFIIVSDNSCAHEINVFGDGEMFDDQCVLLKGRELQQSAEAGNYVLYMGKIGEVVRLIYAKNTSRVRLSYRWIIDYAIVNQCSKNAKVNFHIHPSKGILDNTNSETMFKVECEVSDEIINEQLIGKYCVTATMVVDGIPKESIKDRSIFFEEREDNSELRSITILKLNVLSEYTGRERISLCIDPLILDLNCYKLKTDVCVEKTVNFINNGSYPVHVSWVPNTDKESMFITVEPQSFEVINRAIVSVRVELVHSGGLKETIKFRTRNQDGDTSEAVVFVRGIIEQVLKVSAQPKITAIGAICAGTPKSYNVEFKVNHSSHFYVHRRLYECDGLGMLSLHGVHKCFGPYSGNKNTKVTTLHYETPLRTEATGISCQLAEWSFTGSKMVYTQALTYLRNPDVRLNINTITIAKPIYKSISHSQSGIQLINNSHCDFVYSWGTPVGFDSNKIDCEFKPANGMVNGNSFVEFELIMTPKTSGYFNKYYISCFIQCDALTPQQISIECCVKGFSAVLTYIDMFNRKKNIEWQENQKQWLFNDSFVIDDPTYSEYSELQEYPNSVTKSLSNFDIENSEENNIEVEDQEPGKWNLFKWPKRDTFPQSMVVEQSEPKSNHYYSKIAFKDIECNIAMEQSITIENTSGIPCHVKSRVGYYDYSMSNEVETEYVSKKCMIWIENDDEVLNGHNKFEVTIWVLATAWGQYEDLLTIELHVGTDILPPIYIPIIIQAITFPIEFPLSRDVHSPTIKFSLYFIDSDEKLQIKNNSDIPIQISWRIYNKTEKNKPFGVVFDTLTPDIPNLWSFRIGHYYGSEFPQYFKIEPIILKLCPKELGFVSFYLDRSKEEMIKRDENNIVFGIAVGSVTSLEPAGKNCTRKDGFKLKSVVVKLYSETKHSIQPNLLLQESNNIFKISATKIYNSQSLYYSVTQRFTMLNLLRYPVTLSFKIDNPFNINKLKTLRCSNQPGTTNIRVFYEDLIEIYLEANIYVKNIFTPKMPSEMSSRKYVQKGYLYAAYENGYYKPKMVASFEVHIYFPVIKLSTSQINFGQVILRETKSIFVTLYSYTGPERFIACSKDEVFIISPTDGVVSHKPITLKITFRPIANVQYTSNIEILTTIPMDVIFLKVSGFGIK